MRAAIRTILGLVLAAAPVALWVAWSPWVLVLVLGTCLVCAALLVAVSDAGRSSDDPLAGGAWPRRDRTPMP